MYMTTLDHVIALPIAAGPGVGLDYVFRHGRRVSCLVVAVTCTFSIPRIVLPFTDSLHLFYVQVFECCNIVYVGMKSHYIDTGVLF